MDESRLSFEYNHRDFIPILQAIQKGILIEDIMGGEIKKLQLASRNGIIKEIMFPQKL